MTIAFFITDTNELYADMDRTKFENDEFQWLSSCEIDMGRRSSFTITQESPVFDTTDKAAEWLSENCSGFSDQAEEFDLLDIDPEVGPTEAHYEGCAQLAHEINEIAAIEKLSTILPLEEDHAFLCQIGAWYWSLGHMNLAMTAYERSIEITPEAPTYFNLAICQDDMGKTEDAYDSMKNFYNLVGSEEEKRQVEGMLEERGKSHLIKTDGKKFGNLPKKIMNFWKRN